MNFGNFRRRSPTQTAPRMTVQRHVPWPLRALGWVAAAILGGAAAIFLWQSTVGKNLEQREQLVSENQRLKTTLAELEAEKSKLEALANTAASTLKVEQSAQQTLAIQLRNIETENAKLKADLAYYESLFSSGAASSAGLSIRRFAVEKDRVPNQWQVKAVFVQADKNERDFAGTVQIIVAGTQAGKPTTMTWPEPSKEGAAKSKLNFKRTQRLDETITTPADMVVKTMQLRVLEQGSIRAQQSVNL
jgi:hypothetical protein